MQYEIREMTKYETEIFLRIYPWPEKAAESFFLQQKGGPGGFIFIATDAFLDALEISADNKTKVLLACISAGAVGYLKRLIVIMDEIAKSKNIKHITFEVFSLQIFPHGLPK